MGLLPIGQTKEKGKNSTINCLFNKVDLWITRISITECEGAGCVGSLEYCTAQSQSLYRSPYMGRLRRPHLTHGTSWGSVLALDVVELNPKVSPLDLCEHGSAKLNLPIKNFQKTAWQNHRVCCPARSSMSERLGTCARLSCFHHMQHLLIRLPCEHKGRGSFFRLFLMA